MKKNIFYSYDKIMSYNAFLTFIIGERGVGKTYGIKEFVAKRFIKKGEEFAYIRRYKTEIKESVGSKDKMKFWEQLKNNENLKDHTLTNTKDTILIDGKICGYALPLSVANILKGTSFEKVKTIIFDEFIIDRGCYRYLTNEVEQFLDIIETISRLRDIRVIFLGNAISMNNPYFNYFNLTLPYGNDVKLFKNGLILVNYVKNEAYREVKKKTRFGQLIEDTPYGKYAIDNEFLRDSKTFIQKKTANVKFYMKIKFKNNDIGIWIDKKSDLMFISYDFDSSCPIEFTFIPDDHQESSILIKMKNSNFTKTILNYYKLGKLRFENQKIKNEFIEFINKNI